MRIKKFRAPSMQEALDEAKNNLGYDAVILNTKKIKKKGLLGLLGKSEYEIIAAEQLPNKEKKVEDDNNSIKEIKEELDELKGLLIEMPSNILDKEEGLNPSINKYHRILVSNGVDYNIAFNILKSLNANEKIKDKEDIRIKEIVKHEIKENLGNSSPITIGDERKIVFFIGPTGVGKTTTLAKIASSLVMEEKYKIGLITSDTYRIGAVEQLKIYSDILNLDLEIAYNKEDMLDAYNKFNHKDIILVDTAGRNHNSKEQINELMDILVEEGQIEKYLLVSGTSDSKNLENLVNKYSFLGDYKLIVTKLDEADNYGPLLNIRYLFDKEISYYTIGQDVPEDIRILDIEYIANKLIEER